MLEQVSHNLEAKDRLPTSWAQGTSILDVALILLVFLEEVQASNPERQPLALG